MSYLMRWLGHLVAALAGSGEGPPPFDPTLEHLYAPGALEPPAGVGSDAPDPTRRSAMADASVTVAYYYRTRWGAHDEFVALFDRNHWPILREQLATGRFLDVTASTPRFHGAGDAGWDFLVTITYRDWAAIEEHSDAAIAARLFPDREGHREEERRRFSLLEAHWDVVLEPHALPRA